MNLIQDGNLDDAFVNVGDIGFDFPFYDGSYRSNIFVGSNSYITFGFGSDIYYDFSYTNPGRAIHILSDDRSYQRVYVQANPNSYRIRFEGGISTSGTVGNPALEWEATLYSNGNITLDVGIFQDTVGNNFVTDGGGTNYTTFSLEANTVVELQRDGSTNYIAVAPPGTPNSPSPIDGDTGLALDPLLSWSASGADSYNVWFQNVLVATQTTTSYQTSNTKLALEYTWQVEAINQYGSSLGPVWSFRTQSPAANPPSNLRALEVRGTQVTLAWDAPINSDYLDHYEVKRDGVRVGTPVNAYFQDAVAKNSTYTYEVSSVNPDGLASAAIAVSVTTPDAEPLSAQQQSRIRFHLTQASHVPLQLNNQLTADYNSGELASLNTAIAECDTALNGTTLGGGSLVLEAQEDTNQNIVVQTSGVGAYGSYSSTTTYGNRFKSISRRPSYQKRLSAYYKQVEQLAALLGIEGW